MKNPKVFKKYADIHIVRNKRFGLMIKKKDIASSNISGEVQFILKGAKKRRAIALSCAQMPESDLGVSLRLVALK